MEGYEGGNSQHDSRVRLYGRMLVTASEKEHAWKTGH